LLVACGALVRTTMAMTGFDLGFRTNHVIGIEMMESGRSRVIDTLQSDAEVDAVAAASSIPLGGRVPEMTMSSENGPTISATYNYVTPE